MIELSWGKKQVDKTLLQTYLDRLEQRSICCGDVFLILMPIDIYRYIAEKGINAKLTALFDITDAPPNMVWVRVEKSVIFSLKAQQEEKADIYDDMYRCF